MLVKNVMSPKVVVARDTDSLERAARIMWETDLGFLPVVTGDHRLVGVITDRDICMAAYTRGTSLYGQPVTSAMSSATITCTIHDDAREIEHRMATHQIRRLPVVDDAGRLIGVVTLSDFARASLCGHDLSSRGPTWVLAEITRPRQVAKAS
jgi:CBS domain-containing protein